jgi:hypothetical protein
MQNYLLEDVFDMKNFFKNLFTLIFYIGLIGTIGWVIYATIQSDVVVLTKIFFVALILSFLSLFILNIIRIRKIEEWHQNNE